MLYLGEHDRKRPLLPRVENTDNKYRANVHVSDAKTIHFTSIYYDLINKEK